MPGRAGGFSSGKLESTVKIGNMRIDCWSRRENRHPDSRRRRI
jgi:hypothetical protein